MRPPTTIDVLDRHNGFTAVTLSPTYVKIVVGPQGEREEKIEDYKNGRLSLPFVRFKKVWREHNTLWRPAQLLRRGTMGTLDTFNEQSFYQNNNNVTVAYYKVTGYHFRIAVWFDNSTGERIA